MSYSTDHWNAKSYSQFLDLRTRPARDLLMAIPEDFHPRMVYDLGCGPGNSTILLKKRWPHADIIGLDSSANMLKQAQETWPEIKFIQGNIEDFAPPEKIDCLFANASLQWIEHHELLIPKLFQSLNDGGIFAVQMPNNFHSPSHQVTIKILQDHLLWQPFLNNLRYGELNRPFYYLPYYYDLLSKLEAKCLQLWETEYFHPLSSHEEIFEWVKGTGLRPVLNAMDTENQEKFAVEYIKEIKKAYPTQKNNTILFSFKRIFIIAKK